MVDFNKVMESAKSLISFDKLIGQINGLIDKIPADIVAFYNTNKTLCLIAAVCLLTLIAFEGYKLFKMLIYAGGAFAFGFLGFRYLAPEIPANIKSLVPEIIDFDVAVAVLCALIAVFLCRFAYSFMIMILGGAAGYFLGSMYIYNLLIGYFHTLDFLKIDMVKHIVGGVVSAVFAILFILLFKHLFMLLTSFGCMIDAAFLLQTILIPNADQTIKIACIILGIAIAIFAVVRQYKEEEKSVAIVF